MNARLQMTIKKVLESNGKIAVSKAMLEAGYPPATAKNPQQVTRSKTWQQLMQEYLPDDLLLKKHKEALDANRVISARIIGKEANEQTDDFIEVPDHPTRLKAVELGYKVTHRLAEPAIQVNTSEMTLEFIGKE